MCADANDALTAAECRVCHELSQSPQLANIVPQARTARSTHMRVLVTRFVSGTRFDAFERRLSPLDWARSAERIIDAAETAGRVAAAVLPELTAGRPELVHLQDEVQADLARLAASGLARADIAVLEKAFRDSPALPRLLQHGDLWSKNVLIDGDSTWLIDYAEFGHVQIPLYDVCHLLAHSDRARFRVTGAAASAMGRLSRNILRTRAVRVGLNAQQCAAALLFYLVHIASYRSRGGVSRRFREPYVNELRTAVDVLRSGRRLGDLLTPEPPHGGADAALLIDAPTPAPASQ
jgi:hypothetical protein